VPLWHALAWLGRHGSGLIALGVFLGLLVPPLASLMRPLLIVAIVGPFLISLIRLDWQRLVGHLGRPALVAAALAWLLVLSPLLVHALAGVLGASPALHGGLVLMAAAPPLMASGALALMLGLDVALAVVVTTFATALMPLTLPLIALHLLGVRLDIALGELTLRLALVVGGCFVAAWVLRRVLPPGFATRHAEPLDGLAVLGLMLFAIAIMDGALAMALARPQFVAGCALAVYALNLALQVAGSALFAFRGTRQALTMGLCSGNANLGLLLAALADRAAVELFVFVAVAQLPIYTLPVIQRPLYRRWLADLRRPVGGPPGRAA
jgi:bile acid:Na+ symporter, BASS family